MVKHAHAQVEDDERGRDMSVCPVCHARTLKRRFEKTSVDVTSAYTKLPMHDFPDWNSVAAATPVGAHWVAVEV